MNPLSQHPAAAPIEPFITKEIVAERLQIHRDTVGRWVASGRLPFYRMGRRLRFKWSEIDRHMAQVNRGRVSNNK